jgi:hypothetical protein
MPGKRFRWIAPLVLLFLVLLLSFDLLESLIHSLILPKSSSQKDQSHHKEFHGKIKNPLVKPPQQNMESSALRSDPIHVHYVFGMTSDFGEKPFSLAHYLAVKVITIYSGNGLHTLI